MPEPRLGIAVCTYNGELYLREQLETFLNQSVSPHHVVIADDGSTDTTLTIAREWAAVAADLGIKVTVIDEPGPGGVTANFARALRAVEADLIALSDQDDLWLPQRLEVARRAFDDPKVLLHHANASVVQADGITEIGRLADILRFPAGWPSSNTDAFAQLVRRNLVTGATAMVRRELLEVADPFPAYWVHDEWLAVVAAAHGGIAYTDSLVVRYRQHGSNQIGVSSLNLNGKLARMMQPRGDRHSVLASRAEALRARLASTDAPAAYVALAARKADFERRRAAWPVSRIARLPRVLREASRGTYPRLSSQGWVDVIRDALQPAR